MIAEQTQSTLIEDILAGRHEGIVENLPNEVYRKAPGLSVSGLKEFAKTPAHYQAYLHLPFEETDAMRFGSLVHLMVLEPKVVGDKIELIQGNGNSKEVKDRIAEAESLGKLIIRKQEDLDKAGAMRDAVLSHPKARPLLTEGSAEVSMFWRDPLTGILMKGRIDYLRPAFHALTDLKTTQSTILESNRSLEREIFNRQYHWQSAFYLSGYKYLTGQTQAIFPHVFVEKDPSLYFQGEGAVHAVKVVALNHAAIEKAEYEYNPLLLQYKESFEKNYWPGFSPEIEEVALPHYAWSVE